MIDFKVTVKLNDDDDNKSFEICTHSGTTVEDIVDLIRESLSDSFRRCGTCDVLHPIDTSTPTLTSARGAWSKDWIETNQQVTNK
jgi:hypothetical protein